MINREKANVLIEEYVRERNKAVLSLDVRTFKDFVIRWTKKGGLPSCFIIADDNVIEIALRQMVLGIADAPEDKIEEARAWLKARGYSTEPWKKEGGR